MSLKRKMQKTVACTLTAGLLLGMAGPAAVADPPPHAKAHGRDKDKIKTVVEVKEFKDIRGHWAEEVLVEMNLKGLITGYEDLSFQPSNVVKNIEAIVMLIRALDLEEEAQNSSLEVEFKQGKNIPDWAKGYIQVALDEGLLTIEELQKFNPNQGMKRAELSTLLVRGLKLDLIGSNEFKLDFSDAEEIPKELKRFVGLLVQNGIMKGSSGNLFQPNKPITRAEMAVLLERLNGKLADEERNQVTGVLSSINEETITIKTKDKVQELVLADNAIVYLEGKKVALGELKTGDTIRVIVKDDQVVLIRAQRTVVVETTYNGRITRLILGTDSSVTVTEGRKEYTLKVDAGTRIRIDGKRSFLMDLRVGQEATIIAQGDQAVRIEIGTAKVQEIYKGIVKSLILGTNPGIKMLDSSGKTHEFSINDTTSIYLDDKKVKLEKLDLEMKIKVTIEEDKVLRIDAWKK